MDKVIVFFLLPHILGPNACILPDYARLPVLESIVRAQLCVIASRGGRSYTENELYTIFDEGYIVIFRHLESLFQIKHDKNLPKEASYDSMYKIPTNIPSRKHLQAERESRLSCSRMGLLCSRAASVYSRTGASYSHMHAVRGM